MASVTRLRDLKVFHGDTFVVDTSVLLLVYAAGLGGSSHGADDFADFLGEASVKGARMLVTGGVIAEYVNRRCKTAQSNHPDGQVSGSEKYRRDSFRASAGWPILMKELRSELEQITGLMEVVASPIVDRSAVLAALEEYQREPLDWTDLGLVKLAQVLDAAVVCRDRDFAESRLEFSVVTL